MNNFMNALKNDNNVTYTENGAVTYKSTTNGLLDMFALGGAYRTRSEADCINLFLNAFKENQTYAMKCLYYLRDILEGQGERRFFRVIIKYLAKNYPEVIQRNLIYIPMFGRWDDLYELIDTKLEKDALAFMRKQIELDINSKTPSLLAKWLKSENASSKETAYLALKTRKYLDLTSREYRKLLSALRKKINVLERLMSAGQWDKIEFDKIPSKAGMIYRNAFARHDVERMLKGATKSYKEFAEDKDTKVNAKALYPYEVVEKAMAFCHSWYWNDYRGYKNTALDNTERLMVNKYWENLTDYFNDCTLNGICVADTSGSMSGTPMAVALSIAMYCAEHNKGDFANHFFTFSDRPTFVEIEGVDFVDKIGRMSQADWGGSTNVEAVFDKMLNIALTNHCSQSDIPKNVIIISDMEFNSCVSGSNRRAAGNTLFENIENRWRAAGYQMPELTFWNVNARNNRIPMRKEGKVNFVSGMSPVIFQQIMKGLTAVDLMMDKLNSKRYEAIH